FAIWDSSSQRLMLVRDCMGQKPLYYARWENTFLFASEIKAILQHPAAQREVNSEILPEYLALGYVLPPNTLFKNIYKLAPGHFLMVESDASIQSRAYWKPTIALDESTSRTEQARTLRKKLENAVEMRLMSDVPLGTFLSGGVDSTTITALTGNMTGQAVKSFTVGFDFQKDSIGDRKFNVDLHHARDAAAALGCEHREIVLHHDELLTELLPQLIYAMDEPIADTAIMQTVFVAALARVHGVPVLLSGDGADEIFGGYPFFQAANRIERYKSLVPGVLRDYLIHPFIQQLPDSGRFVSLHKLADKAALHSPGEHFLSWESNHRFAGIHAVLQDQDIAQRGTVGLLQKLDSMLADLPVKNMLDRIAYARLRLWLAEDNNMRVDKISMAMSIEVRSPFEDHEMVDFGLSVPLKNKLPDGGKAVLKDAVADLIPEESIKRAKWGFEPPMSEWLRTIFRPLVDTYLSK
ncbi:MAG TPA: asparagine synthase (glutamine-hydrolyzing), partial [Aggregatilineales bacterium]|nr:asparagine synthase (glutamine-hydrolyzing) [Aggregatilineales bacterium]